MISLLIPKFITLWHWTCCLMLFLTTSLLSNNF
jgi:hypothetical protein